MKLEFSQQILKKYSDAKLMKIHSVGAELFQMDRLTDGETDRETDRET